MCPSNNLNLVIYTISTRSMMTQAVLLLMAMSTIIVAMMILAMAKITIGSCKTAASTNSKISWKQTMTLTCMAKATSVVD